MICFLHVHQLLCSLLPIKRRLIDLINSLLTQAKINTTTSVGRLRDPGTAVCGNKGNGINVETSLLVQPLPPQGPAERSLFLSGESGLGNKGNGINVETSLLVQPLPPRGPAERSLFLSGESGLGNKGNGINVETSLLEKGPSGGRAKGACSGITQPPKRGAPV